MMKKVLFSFFVSLFVFSSSFALQLESPIVLEGSNEESISISWDPVDGALGYYVYYDIKSFAGKEDYSQIPRFIEETEATVEWLEDDTEYYIAISVVDDIWDEWVLSQEVIFKTKKAKEESLSLIALSLNNEQELKAGFNKVLDSSSEAEREFRIIKQDSKEEILIDTVELSDDRSVIINLFEALEVSTDYEITIIALSDKDGNSIESWIDGIALFSTPESFEEAQWTNLLDWWNEEEVLNSAPEDNKEEWGLETTQEEESVSEEWNSIENWFDGNAGKNLSQEELDKLTLNAAKESENLPQTWPESILLFIFAWIIAFFVFYFQKKRVEDIN